MFGCDGRNPFPVRAAARASAPATNSPDMSSTTVGKGHTSKLLCSSFVLKNIFIIIIIFLQLVAVLVFRCPVEGCPEAFVTHASMKNHMARIHCKQEKPYQVLKSCPLFQFYFQA